jgi:hypothetical protein
VLILRSGEEDPANLSRGPDPTAHGAPGEDGDDPGECLLTGVLDTSATPAVPTEGNDTTICRSTLTITNTSDGAIRTVTLHSFSNGPGLVGTWVDGGRLEPGSSVDELLTGQSFEDGTTTWDVATNVAAYAHDDSCAAQWSGVDDLTEPGDAAVPIVNPRPVGP